MTLLFSAFFSPPVWALVVEESAPDEGGKRTNRELTQALATADLSTGDLAGATATLSGYLKGDPDDAGGWNLLGLVTLQQKGFLQASEYFDRAVKTAKGEARALFSYSLALAFSKAGKKSESEAALRASVEFDDRSESVVREAQGALARSEEFPPFRLDFRAHYRTLFHLSAGYDTNVLLASDPTYASATGAQSFVYSPSIAVTRAGELRNQPFTVTGGASFNGYTSREALAYNALTGLASAGWGSLGSASVGLRAGVLADFDTTYLNSAGLRFFSWNAGIRGGVVVPLSERSQLEFELPLRYQKFSTANGADGADDRSGPGLRPRLTWRGNLGAAHRLGFGVRYEWVQTLGSNYRSRAWAPQAQWTWVGLPVGLSLNTDAELSVVSYPDSSPIRSDQIATVSVSLGRALWSDRVFGSVGYLFRRSVSSVPAAQYSKHSITLGVSYAL